MERGEREGGGGGERERERDVATPHFRQLDEADKEASVFARDEDGRTALHHAARLGESHDILKVHSGSPYNVHGGHMTYYVASYTGHIYVFDDVFACNV